jgi:hypothetical protein
MVPAEGSNKRDNQLSCKRLWRQLRQVTRKVTPRERQILFASIGRPWTLDQCAYRTGGDANFVLRQETPPERGRALSLSSTVNEARTQRGRHPPHVVRHP